MYLGQINTKNMKTKLFIKFLLIELLLIGIICAFLIACNYTFSKNISSTIEIIIGLITSLVYGIFIGACAHLMYRVYQEFKIGSL